MIGECLDMKELYNHEYYHNCCGPIPYESDSHFLEFFRGIANRIVADFHPKTVLDAGCAMGYLVAALRDLGVEAYGVDISEYAISMVRDDIKPYCFVGSLAEDLPRELPKHFDIVTSIEVLEHMYAEDGEKAIHNICAVADRILFSSSPNDFTENTHFNVQQREYWAKCFATEGFLDEVNYEPSYITSWAVCYVKSDNWLKQVEDYERSLRITKTEMVLKIEAKNQEIERLSTEGISLREKFSKIEEENNFHLEELTNEKKRYVQLENELSELQKSRDNFSGLVVALSAERGNLCKELALAETKVNNSQKELERVKAELSVVIDAYNEMSNAFFWKISKPARVILDMLKRLKLKEKGEIKDDKFVKRDKVTCGQDGNLLKKKIMTKSSYEIPESTKINARESVSDIGARLNLVIPSILVEHTFGGVATAIRFFEELCDEYDCASRIIVTDAFVKNGDRSSFHDYTIIDAMDDVTLRKQIVEMVGPERKMKSIPVSAEDIFVVTAWWTACSIADVIRWQAEKYGKKAKPLIYLIQDYEPGFYPWSSRYMLAESTYRFEFPTYAVINSKLLCDFFDQKKYIFEKKWYFEPMINPTLKKFLPRENGDVSKKKQILFYGRPTAATRNMFELIISALSIWCEKEPNAAEWAIFSAGEKHENIVIGRGVEIQSLGKLSIEDYAKVMIESYAGISLMASPHPSYPPLEMSSFGMKTITNCFENKDMANFNQNIISVKSCAPLVIANELLKITQSYNGKGYISIDSNYIAKTGEFDEIPSKLATVLRSN